MYNFWCYPVLVWLGRFTQLRILALLRNSCAQSPENFVLELRKLTIIDRLLSKILLLIDYLSKIKLLLENCFWS